MKISKKFVAKLLDTIKLHSSLHTECFETSWKKLVCLWAAVVFVLSERIVNFCKSRTKETKSLKLRKKCSNLVFFWSVFSSIRSEYGYLFCQSSYSVRIRENTDQTNFEFRHFSRNVSISKNRKLILLTIQTYM